MVDCRLKESNLDAPKQNSVVFFHAEYQENVVSLWKRAIMMAAKVGKGLSKDDKAKLLAAKHWIEAIDPLHRYGGNLKFYYDEWFNSHSSQPFLYWLDSGYGKQVDLKGQCPRTELQQQRVQYLGPRGRREYEVIVRSGKLVYQQNGAFVHTIKEMKWIYVLSTSRCLFVGRKEKGFFHHSSFLAGAAVIAAGQLVVSHGTIEVLSKHSGHYCPTKENFAQLIQFLKEKKVDLRNVKVEPEDLLNLLKENKLI